MKELDWNGTEVLKSLLPIMVLVEGMPVRSLTKLWDLRNTWFQKDPLPGLHAQSHQKSLLALPFLSMDFVYILLSGLLGGTFFWSKRCPLSTSFISSVQNFISREARAKKHYLGTQCLLTLTSSGNSGHLNIVLTCVHRYSSLSHYLIWIPLDVCLYSCAVQNWLYI